VLPRRLLVLDVDGVMIDADRSFAEAVGRALKELAPQQAWDDSDFLAFKRVGGFNNDFRLAAGALALAERGEMDRLRKAEGIGFPDLEERIQALEPRCQEVVQRHYAVTKELEKPLITRGNSTLLVLTWLSSRGGLRRNGRWLWTCWVSNCRRHGFRAAPAQNPGLTASCSWQMPSEPRRSLRGGYPG